MNINDIEHLIIICGYSLILFLSFIAFSIYWFFKESHTFMLEIQMWLVFTITCNAIVYLLPVKEDSFLCPTEAVLNNTFYTGERIWSCIIGYSCLITMMSKNEFENHRIFYRCLFIFFGIFFPLITSSIVVLFDSYGEYNSICWIDMNNTYKRTITADLQLIYYVLYWILLGINLIFIFKILYYLKGKRYVSTLYSYIKWYPICICFFQLIGLAKEILQLFITDNHIIIILDIMNICCDIIKGIIFMIIFFLTPDIFQSIKILFELLCGKKNENLTEEISENDFISSEENTSDLFKNMKCNSDINAQITFENYFDDNMLNMKLKKKN